MNAIEQVKQAEKEALEMIANSKQKALDDLDFARDYVKREQEQILAQADEERELIFQRSRIDKQRKIDRIGEETKRAIEKLDAIDDKYIEPAVNRILDDTGRRWQLLK